MADPDRFEALERLLAERGRDVRIARIRVAAGRTGVAVGFAEGAIVHISWAVLAAGSALSVLAATRRSRRGARSRRRVR